LALSSHARPTRRFHQHVEWPETLEYQLEVRDLTAGGQLRFRLPSERAHPGLSRLPEHANEEVKARFSPDGETLAVFGWDHAIQLWDLSRGAPALPPDNGHTARVTSLATARTGELLVSSGWDDTVRFWDPSTGQEHLALRKRGGTAVLRVSPDGATLAALTGSTREGHTISLWSMDALDSEPRAWTRSSDIAEAAIGQEADIAFVSDEALVVLDVDQRVHGWRWGESSHELVVDARGSGEARVSLAASPASARVAITGGGLARLFSLPSGAPVSSLRTGQDGRATAAFSPDGAALVVLDARGLTLWDAGRGAVLHRLERPALEAFDLSPDGQTIAAVDESATLHLWRQRDASWRHETRALQPGAYKQVRFLADGRTVAVSVAHLIWLVELSQADREQPAARSER
jgi:WD40 repeat protein